MEIVSSNGTKELSENLQTFNDRLVVLFFFVGDSAECQQMDDVISEISKTTEDKAAVIKINAKEDAEICKQYNIASAPAFVFLQNSNVVDTLVGANAPAFSKKFEDNVKSSESMDQRLKKLINKSNVMLFMKGNPNMPRCGFSKQVIALLDSHNAKYETFDILEDYDVREALKKFSNWPTYPQLYVKAKEKEITEFSFK
ncbi:hypothetical protein JTE90_013725 [Oedothorax gibbosus]|uniref:Glutaredoxin-like protein n=1 Tax=Oedothorax gibbosus TaxID=931172 RepID=A0AAV6V032_9ARAC|nr:hypothetical protein JTE90_013725 [Oedothorax gibbosus]